MVDVELVFIAQDGENVHIKMALESGATVADALQQSEIHKTHPETKDFAVGIYGVLVSSDVVLKEGDRVEIYRPLTRDPKEKRRQLAKGKK